MRRHKSTPRPRHVEPPRSGSSFEPWEGKAIETSSHSRLPYSASNTPRSDDRRSKSSMRHQSVQRQQQPPQSYATANSSSSGSRNGAPQSASRSVSTGRMRKTQTPKSRDNPVDVANQIWQLRERRESQSSQEAMNKARSYTNLPSDKTPTGNRLHHAETKISGLLDELEELKFFEEIETAPVTTPRNPTPKTPRQMQSVNPTPLSNMLPAKRDQSHIPIVIRAASNPRAARLPPPPPTGSGGVTPSYGNANAVTTPRNPPPTQPSQPRTSLSASSPRQQPKTVQMRSVYKPLSPRKISKMDRHELELECQTLVRELQLVEKERNALASEMEQFRHLGQESRQDKALISRLEEELRQVSNELQIQFKKLQHGKDQVTEDYQARLRDQATKLHKTQELTDAIKADLTTARQQLNKTKKQLEEVQTKYRQKDSLVNELKAREAVLELQLTESQSAQSSMASKMERKKQDMARLQEEVRFSREALQANMDEKDETYEVRIAALEQQLSLSSDKTNRLQDEIDTQARNLMDKEHEVKLAKAKDAQQGALIMELQDAMDELRNENNEALNIRKEESSASTTKMQGMVQKHADEINNFEGRIQSLQEQLKHQTDRHHAELNDRQRQNEQDMEEMKQSLTDQIREDESIEAEKLRKELVAVRQSYDQTQQDLYHKLDQSKIKERSTCEEYERQDEARMQELEHMHDRLDAYMKEIKERDEQINKLATNIETGDSKQRDYISEMQSMHATEILEREESMEAQRKQFRSMESKLKNEIQKQESEFGQLEKARQEAIAVLQSELEETRQELANAQSSSSEETTAIGKRLDELQADYEAVQTEFSDQRQRNEEIANELRVEVAKLEGKLRASDASLRQKRARIDDLEQRLDRAASASREDEHERISEMESLRIEIDETVERLDKERLRAGDKDATIRQLQEEIQGLKVEIKSLGHLEVCVKDMQKQVSSAEDEKERQAAELYRYRKSYEETTTKLIEMEEKLSIEKEDIESELKKKDRHVSDMEVRYSQKIESLEQRLERASKDKRSLDSAMEDLQKSLVEMTADKRKREAELANLRSDYEDISGLLEENLHASAKKQDLETLLEQRQANFSQTEKEQQQKIGDLESKIEQSNQDKKSMESTIARLQETLANLEEEKSKQSDELAKAFLDCKNVGAELQQTQRNHSMSKDGIEAELNRKDKQLRETVQRYSTRIAELESKLEEEMQTKMELDDKLSSARSELEDKQKQTQELIQRNTKNVMKLEGQIEGNAMEKDELQVKLREAHEELENKRREIKETIERYRNEIYELQNVKKDHDGVKAQFETTTADLQKKDSQVEELKIKIPKLLAELDDKTKESHMHKERAIKFEKELNKNQLELNGSVDEYNKTISTLKAQLDDQVFAHKSTEQRADGARGELDRRQSEIEDLSHAIAEMKAKLDHANRSKESSKQKAELALKELEEKESYFRMFEMEKIEFETRMHTQSRAKDELRTKVSELTSKVERKEREIREVTDRYKMYIMELESKLDQDSTAKYRLQEALDMVKTDAAGASSEVDALREKIAYLEQEVEAQKSRTRDAGYKVSAARQIEDKLHAISKERDDIEMSLKKANGEKAEVIEALEGVIHEVQNREEEIESLSEMLHKKDEELEHAKIIATKALASAKDIQKRYKDKDRERQSDLIGRVDELSDKINSLTAQNETLERKTSMMERDLKEKALECKRLKDQLRQIDGRSLADDVSSFSNNSAFSAGNNSRSKLREKLATESKQRDNDDNTQSTFSMTRSYSNTESINPARTLNFELGSFSPESAKSSSAFGRYLDGEASDGQRSTGSPDSGSDESLGSGDMDSDSRTGGESLSSQSRKSVERDALRKYVRSRYMNKRAAGKM